MKTLSPAAVVSTLVSSQCVELDAVSELLDVGGELTLVRVDRLCPGCSRTMRRLFDVGANDLGADIAEWASQPCSGCDYDALPHCTRCGMDAGGHCEADLPGGVGADKCPKHMCDAPDGEANPLMYGVPVEVGPRGCIIIG